MTTTYRAEGYRFTIPFGVDTITAVAASTLEVEFPDATTSVRYSVLGIDGDGPAIPNVEITPDAISLSVDGADFTSFDDTLFDVESEFGQVTWSGGTSYFIGYLFDDFQTQTSYTYIFQLAGAPLPDLSTTTAINSFVATNFDGFGIAGGGFGPNTDIALASLDWTSVVDNPNAPVRREGTTEAETLDGDSGDDQLYGDGFAAHFASATAATVFRLYQATLDRAPDRAGQIDWTERLETGARTLNDVANGFIGSAEFQNVYGDLSNNAFVNQLYRNVLNREADESGLADWVGRLDSGTSRAEVVLGFSQSPEFVANTQAAARAFERDANPSEWVDEVYRVYRATLDREPDAGGLGNWTTQLANGRTLDSVIEGFTGSTEFQTVYGALDNTAFVTLLYNNVLNRDPDTGGLADWVGRLEGGTGRSEVVRGFSESAEFIAGTRDATVAYMRGITGDTLDGDAGNDTYAGGFGADRFIFDATEAGSNVVLDLEPWDLIVLRGFGAMSPAELRAAMSTQDGDAVFAMDGVEIRFDGVALDDITETMITTALA